MAQNVYSKNGNVGRNHTSFDTYQGQEYLASDDQNYEENGDEYDGCPEYPIGDGQGITGFTGEYNPREGPPHFRLNKNFNHISDKPKISAETLKLYQHQARLYGHNFSARGARGSSYQSRNKNPLHSHYRSNYIGDYADYSHLTKNQLFYANHDIASGSSSAFPGKYSQPECIMRRLHKTEAVHQKRTLDQTCKRNFQYAPDTVNFTYEQLKNTFTENYEIDARKQRPSRSVDLPRSYDSRLMATPRLPLGTMHDKKMLQRKIAMRRSEKGHNVNEKCDISQKTSNSTKSTPRNDHRKNNPQPCEVQLHDLESKETNETVKRYDEHYENSFSYAQLYESKQGGTTMQQHSDESDLEVKYKNKDFRANDILKESLSHRNDESYHCEPSSICESSTSDVKNEATSDEKICLPKNHSSSQLKTSARSGHSKNSTIGSNKSYKDIVQLERSKCTVLSVIDDGIQRIEQSRNDTMCTTPKSVKSIFMKSNKHDSDVHAKDSKDKSTSSSLDIVRSDFINNIFKECRDYHLEKIKQEVQRLQYFNFPPEKWVKENNSSTSSSS